MGHAYFLVSGGVPLFVRLIEFLPFLFPKQRDSAQSPTVPHLRPRRIDHSSRISRTHTMQSVPSTSDRAADPSSRREIVSFNVAFWSAVAMSRGGPLGGRVRRGTGVSKAQQRLSMTHSKSRQDLTPTMASSRKTK